MIRASRLVGAVVAVVSLTAVSGCSTAEAGSAAVVGDRRITVAAVQSAYTDIVPLVGQDQQITQTDVLNWLILEPYLVQAAGQLGRGVSEHDAELEFQQVPTAPTPSAAGVTVVRANLANVQLQSGRTATDVKATFEQIGTELKKAGVHVNPRYGSGIDYTNFTILPVKQDWLQQSAAATPEPSTAP